MVDAWIGGMDGVALMTNEFKHNVNKRKGVHTTRMNYIFYVLHLCHVLEWKLFHYILHW
jgi:hypothetical protein